MGAEELIGGEDYSLSLGEVGQAAEIYRVNKCFSLILRLPERVSKETGEKFAPRKDENKKKRKKKKYNKYHLRIDFLPHTA